MGDLFKLKIISNTGLCCFSINLSQRASYSCIQSALISLYVYLH